MSKIRKKAKLKKIDGSYPEKSGVLSKSIKKIIQDEDSLQGRIPSSFDFINSQNTQNTNLEGYLSVLGSTDESPVASDLITPIFNRNKFKLDSKNIYFDDQKIKSLSSQKINPALGVTSSLINQTTLFSKGNHFLTSSDFEIETTVDNSNFNILKENDIYSLNKNVFFDENLVQDSNKKEIIIDLRFNDDLILDNLIDIGNTNIDNYTFTKNLLSPESYKSHGAIAFQTGYNKNLAYYNFNRMGWDYIVGVPNLLGSINYTRSNYPVFSPSVTPTSLISSSSLGAPIQNLGFPWKNEYSGGHENLFYMGNYISQNFVLEEVVFECNMTSRCETFENHSYFETSNNISLSNLINFFILNQKSNNVNVERFLSNAQTQTLTASFDITNNTITDVNVDSNLISDFTDPDLRRFKGLPYGQVGYPFVPSSNDTDNVGYRDFFKSFLMYPFNNRKFTLEQLDRDILYPTHREIVTFNNLLMYNNYCGDLSNVDWNSASKEINLVHQIDTGTNSSNAHITFTNNTFVISGSCVKSNKYQNGYAFSYYKNRDHITDDQIQNSLHERSVFFLSNNFGERDNLGNLSGRETSTFAETAKVLTSSLYTHNNKLIKHNSVENIKNNSPYILSPEDTLIFGISSFSNIDEFPALLKLHNNLRIRLIGRYENIEDDNIASSNKRGMTSNSVRSTIIGNTTVVNQYDTEPIYFMSGSYLDNRFTGDIKSSSGRTIEGSLSSGLEGSFTRTVTLEDTENTIYDSMMPNIFEIWRKDNKFPFHNSTKLNGTNLIVSSQYNNGAPDGGSLNNISWQFSFPFDTKYQNVRREISRNYILQAAEYKYTDSIVTGPGGISVQPVKPGFRVQYDVGTNIPTSALEDYYISISSSEENFNNILFGSFDRIYGYEQGIADVEFYYGVRFSKFKYGVYNANPVTLTKHFNWRSYGQFSDRYNGSINTAFFNFDQSVRYPVEKSFVDSEQNSIEASSVADTYNTDEYARSGRPFFD